MNIEPYTENEKNACLAIFDSNVGIYFADWERDSFETFLQNHACQLPYFVLSDNDTILACGGYELTGHNASLTWGMVDRDRHGQSFGSALLKHRLDLIGQEAPGATVEIDTSQRTQGFYKKFGFSVLRIEEDGYQPGLDKVFMRLLPAG